MRLIDADALEKYLSDAEIEATRQRKYVFASALNTICGNVRNFPTIEPERKKGKWVGKERFVNSPEFYSWQCSVCGCVLEDPTLDKPYPFCPNCGADMRGEEDED